MKNTMTKAEMAKMLEAMAAELAALKAEKETSTKSESVPAPAKRGAGKTAKASSKPKATKESAPIVLPVRKGKAVGFDGWLNHKVWIHNKPLMESLKGEYDRATRTIVFPTVKAATEFCSKFVPKLTDEEYAESRRAIDESFKARAAEKEKAAASKSPKETAPAKPSKKSGSLIAKTAKSGKKGADKETAVPVKKPEWRERAGKGEKPFADYSTYKEYWHAAMGK